MNTPNCINEVRYDSAHSLVLLHEADSSLWSEYADLTALANALTAGAVPDTLLPVVGGYALALAAREHSDWPTESRRAALIQAAQQVLDGCPANASLDQLLDDALALADDAFMRGDADIEGKLVAFAGALRSDSNV